MVTRRAAKSKGSQFEYHCEFNLRKRFPGVYLTKERGFQRQYDIRSDMEKIAVECKFHRTMSWNQMKEYLFKLQKKAPDGYTCFLLVKTNRQPCLVMYEVDDRIYVEEFEHKFGVEFGKHPSTRGK